MEKHYQTTGTHVHAVSFPDNRVSPEPVVGQYPTTQGSILVPDSVRRPKPTDLFAAATISRAHSQHFTFSTVTYSYQRDDGGFVTDTGPASYWATHVSAPHALRMSLADFGELDLKMRLKIKDQKVDLLTSVAELGKTANMVTDLASDIVSSFNSLKRGRPVRDMRRALTSPSNRADRRLANRWLEVQWGWMPTINDIYGTAEAAVAKFDVGFPLYQYVASEVNREYNVSVGLVVGQTSVRTIKRVRARYVVQKPDNRTLAQLGVLNPVSMLYQLTPWSFALDWVLSVGDFLEGFDALLGVSNLLVQRSYGFDVKYLQKLTIGSSAGYSLTGYEKVRARLGVSDELSLDRPRFRNPLDTGALGTRLANVAALVRQMRH